MTTALITCAGAGTRWKSGTPKQLADVEGVPLLHRTVRQCIEHRMRPVIVATDDAFRVDGAEFFSPGDTKWWASTLRATRQLWDGEMVCLLGDVFFSPRAFRQIVTTGPAAPGIESWAKHDGFRFYGRRTLNPITGGPQEVFACRWDNRTADDLFTALTAAVDHADGWSKPGTYDATGKPIGSPWQAYRAAIEVDLEREEFDSTIWVESPTDFTDDFDTFERYRRWCEVYARRWIKQGPLPRVEGFDYPGLRQ